MKQPEDHKRKYVSEIDKLPEPVMFDLDGVRYECRELGSLEISEMAGLQGEPADSPRAIAFMAEFFRSLLGRDQYMQFKENTTRERTKPEVFVKIIEGIFEDFAEGRSERPSESSDGPASVETKSSDVLSDRVIERLEGRPDLQTAVLHARSSG